MLKEYELSDRTNALIDALEEALENKNNLKEDMKMSNENKKAKIYYGLEAYKRAHMTAQELAAIEKRKQVFMAKLGKNKKPKPVEGYYPIDNTWTDKFTGERRVSTKYVVTKSKEPNKIWEWYPFSYRQIGHPKSRYSSLPVPTNLGTRTISECLDTLRELERRGSWDRHKKLKTKVDTLLDIYSKRYKKELEDAYYNAEWKIKQAEEYSIDLPAELMYQIEYPVMYYKLADDGANYYNGSVKNTVSTYYFEKLPGCSKNYYEEHVVATNSTIKLDTAGGATPKLHYNNSAYKKFIELGTVFNLQPHFSWMYKDGDSKTSERIFSVTKAKIDEFIAAVNWYVGQAEQGVDLSDEITLHHPDGVHTITITKYERYKNSEKYEEWYETELRDFQYEAKGEEDEYEAEADILDD